MKDDNLVVNVLPKIMMKRFLGWAVPLKNKLAFWLRGPVSYYLRHLSIGFVASLLVLTIWSSFSSSGVVKGILSINSSIIDFLKNNYVQGTDGWQIVIGILFVALVFYFVVKNWQTSIRISLNNIGFYAFLFLGDKISTNLMQIRIDDDFVLLNVLFLVSLTIIILNLIFGAPFLKKFVRFIKKEINAFELKFHFIFTIDINLLRIVTKARKYIKEIYDSNKGALIMDDPLTDISEINLIQDFMEDKNIFSKFISSRDELKNLIDVGIPKINSSINKASRSVCIDGSWGIGKTSLVNIVKREILSENPDHYIWIDFEPWNFNNCTELISNFFDTLNKELIKKHKVDLQPSLGPYVDLITPILEPTGFVGSIKMFLQKLSLFDSGQKDMGVLKKDISRKLRRLPDEVVIVLDNIDRLKNEEVDIVLQLVRQLSDFSNILFILPFDYDRVQNLIVQNRGEEYADFLKKIIISKIKLADYSFDELRAIFAYYVNDPKKEKEKWDNLFYDYVLERIRPRFAEIRRRQDEADEKSNKSKEAGNEQSSAVLKPMAIFVKNLYESLYPSSSYLNEIYEVVDGMKNFTDLYLSDYYKDTNSLIEGIVMHLSRFRKISLAADFYKNRDTMINIFNGLGLQGQLNDVFGDTTGLLIRFTDSLKNGYVLSGIVKEYEDFVTNQYVVQAVDSNPEMATVIDKIKNQFEAYEKEIEGNLKSSNVKNWFVEDIMPREVKRLSEYVIKKGSDLDYEILRQEIIEFAQTH